MTYEEAITILRKDRDLCLFNPMTGEEKPMNEDCRLSAEALTLAIEALEKQMPKKLTHEATLYHSCTCPACKNVLDEFTGFKGERVRVITDWCKFCGQALDWSDA